MKTYRAAVIGCGSMGGFADDEYPGSHPMIRPIAIGAGFEACGRTQIVACCELRPDVMEEFGMRYGVPKERQYADYRELIENEQLDIVGVVTQPEHRAEIMIYAAEHGVKAIYSEKALCASMDEADAIVEAVESKGVAFNMGTGRRWYPGFIKMKEIVDSGDLGELEMMVMCYHGGWVEHGCHVLDLCLMFNTASPVKWVQATMSNAKTALRGDTIVEDPDGSGMIRFENGVTAHIVDTSHPNEHQLFLSGGYLGVYNTRQDWQMRRLVQEGPRGGRKLVAERFPNFEPASPTVRIIEDLVHAVDTGEPTRGGVRVARDGMAITLGFAESHRRGGERVALPGRECSLRLDRAPDPRPIVLHPR